MKKLTFVSTLFIIYLFWFLAAGYAGPPAIPPPPTVTDAEIAAQTSNDNLRSFSVDHIVNLTGISIDLDTVGASSGSKLLGTAGEAITIGYPILLSPSTEKWVLADADVLGLYPATHIAAASVAQDAEVYGVKKGEMVFAASTFTAGEEVYLSDTPGIPSHTAPPTSGDCAQSLGRAIYDDLLSIDVATSHGYVK